MACTVGMCAGLVGHAVLVRGLWSAQHTQVQAWLVMRAHK